MTWQCGHIKSQESNLSTSCFPQYNFNSTKIKTTFKKKTDMLKECIYQIHGPILWEDCLILQLLPETTKQIRKTTLPVTKGKRNVRY